MLGALREGLADPFAAERPHVWVAPGVCSRLCLCAVSSQPFSHVPQRPYASRGQSRVDKDMRSGSRESLGLRSDCGRVLTLSVHDLIIVCVIAAERVRNQARHKARH